MSASEWTQGIREFVDAQCTASTETCKVPHEAVDAMLAEYRALRAIRAAAQQAFEEWDNDDLSRSAEWYRRMVALGAALAAYPEGDA